MLNFTLKPKRCINVLLSKALIKSGQEARKLAEMTGTPLVVRNNNTLQPSSPIQT